MTCWDGSGVIPEHPLFEYGMIQIVKQPCLLTHKGCNIGRGKRITVEK